MSDDAKKIKEEIQKKMDELGLNERQQKVFARAAELGPGLLELLSADVKRDGDPMVAVYALAVALGRALSFVAVRADEVPSVLAVLRANYVVGNKELQELTGLANPNSSADTTDILVQLGGDPEVSKLVTEFIDSTKEVTDEGLEEFLSEVEASGKKNTGTLN